MRRPRIGTLVALGLVVGAFLALVGISLTNALVYYVTPTELAADLPTGSVRLYGVVEPGSVRWDAPSSTLSFRVTDGQTTMAVVSRSLPTGLFRDGIGVVLAGRATSAGEFAADEVLVKHSEVYEPLRPGQTPPPGLLDTLRQEAP
jgi:cytochrome c-type biogenesis protein CcmE